MPSPTSADLIFAVRFSTIEKVKELLAQGADVNGKDSVGNTALIYAAGREGNYVEVARLLLGRPYVREYGGCKRPFDAC